MRRTSLLIKGIAVTLVLAVFVTWSGSDLAQAMLVPTQTAHDAVKSARAQDVNTVQAALENKVISQRLANFGLSKEEINTRLGRMSDSEIHRVAMQIEKQNPAGDASGIVLIAIAVLLLL